MPTLEDFLKEYHPDILADFKAYCQKPEDYLIPGEWYVSLKAGFSGPAGQVCQFVKHIKPGDFAGKCGWDREQDTFYQEEYFGFGFGDRVDWLLTRENWWYRIAKYERKDNGNPGTN